MDKKLTKRVLFVGIPDMAFIGIDGLISAGVNIVGVVGPKKNHEMFSAFKNFIIQRGLNFIDYNELDDADFIQKLKELKLDIAVVCSFNYKIPKVMLDTAKDGFINVHPSLLPNYRGGNPYSRVIYNQEPQSGVSIHFMDESFDTGDIIYQEVQPLWVKETMGTLFNRLNLLGVEMLIKVLNSYEKEPIMRIPQPKGNFKKALSFSDAEQYIDFSMPAEKIEALVRALNPFIIAKTMFRKTPVKVIKVDYTNDSPPNGAKTGEVVKTENNNVYIATGKGMLIPKVIQFGSYFCGDSEDIVNILQPQKGEFFGWTN